MTEENKIRIMSVDDHPALRDGINAMISSQADMRIVAQAANGHEGIQKFRDRTAFLSMGRAMSYDELDRKSRETR